MIRGILATTAMVTLACVAAPASAQAIYFDVEAQPLAEALTAIGRQAGIEILSSSEITAGKRSAPVRGRMTAREALVIALSGSGLEIREQGDRAFAIVAAASVGQQQVAVGEAVIDGIAGQDEVGGGDIIVSGVRQAEQSAIIRKRTSRTVQDSIVADDVGQFPDKNAAEAIARIAGVALDVNDDGVQGGFTIRGQDADLVRVEVDGMTTLSTLGGDQGGRAASVADISSDLIKSVDVIKGQTADMTPGGVGGTVRIEQRSGLDFKEPFYQLNLQAQYNTVSERTLPRINVIATRRFFDGDVGLLFNGTYENSGTSTDLPYVSQRQVGYNVYGDHDNSPEKTFTTPFDPIAAAVTNKANCAALPTTGIDSRRNCYAQWEDFVPSQPRFRRALIDEERFSAQLRADWQVNDDLVLFVSANPNYRRNIRHEYNFSLPVPTGATGTNGLLTGNNFRNVVVNENHYVTSYDMVRSPTTTVPVGYIGNVALTSQVRKWDREFQQHYGQVGADFTSGPYTVKARAQYTYAKYEGIQTAMAITASLPSATTRLVPESGLYTIEVPESVDLTDPASYMPPLAAGTPYSGTFGMDSTPEADRNDEWNFQVDAERDFYDFGPLTRIKVGLQHRRRNNTSWRFNGFTVTPGVVVSSSQKIDTIRFCDPAQETATIKCVFGSTPFTTSPTSDQQLYKVHTLTPDQFRSLVETAITPMPGGTYFNVSDRGDLLTGWTAIDIDRMFNKLGEYADLSAYSFDTLFQAPATNGQLYDKPPYSTGEYTTSAYAMADFGADVLGMRLEANAGVRFQQIKVQAAPVIDFAQRVAVPRVTTPENPLPGYVIQDNVYERSVGQVDRTSTDILPSFNAALWPVPDKLGLRYSIALQRARPSLLQITGNSVVRCGSVSEEDRATLEALLASDPSLIDDGNPATSDEDESENIVNSFINRCNNRIGNPELKGYQAVTQNLSLEWYPNRDTQLSIAAYEIAVKTGRPEGINIDAYQLGDLTYAVSSYQDGPGGLKTYGFEVAGRTAFTFLPWKFQYLGGGFNYSYSRTNQENTATDLFTGIALPPRGQSKYYYNVNLWYDDGRLNARVAYQRRAAYYDRTAFEQNNRIPSNLPLVQGFSGSGTVGNYYKIVSPIFRNVTSSLDARASYNITDSAQLFVEGKNLLDFASNRFVPQEYRNIADGVDYRYDATYNGQTYYAGVILKF